MEFDMNLNVGCTATNVLNGLSNREYSPRHLDVVVLSNARRNEIHIYYTQSFEVDDQSLDLGTLGPKDCIRFTALSTSSSGVSSHSHSQFSSKAGPNEA